MNTNSSPLVSIITVVYNDKVGLENTIKSVFEQDYDSVEFIIIDGGSTDGTVDVIKKHEDKIDYYSSEKDKGIYDAMNKGITASKGTWVNFMNAGDVFYSKSVLSNVFNSQYYINKALVYGYKFQDSKPVYPLEVDSLKKGIIMANHQSMFFNSEILKNELIYSLKYPIYGDYELVNRIHLKFGKQTFQYIDAPIAIYEGGGISSVVSKQKRKDKYLIIIRHYGLFNVLTSFLTSMKQKLT